MNDKDMIERYIYEVTKRVPQDTREEIRMELSSLIEDMCDKEDVSVEEVLQKLGNPAEFARQYTDGPDYLIGPEYYEHYMWLNKIGMIAIGISSVISGMVQAIVHSENIVRFFAIFISELCATFFSSAFGFVGVLTIVFAILERKKVKVDVKPKVNWSVDKLQENIANVKSWTPRLLPPIPDKRAVISRGDCVFSMVFILVLVVILLFAPQLFGYFQYDGDNMVYVASVFNLAEWSRIVPLLAGCLMIGLLQEVIMLVTGYYCKVVMYSRIITNIIQIIGAAVLLYVCPLWNPEFANSLKVIYNVTEFAKGDLLNYWGTSAWNHVIFGGICLLSLIEIGVTVYKTMRYSR